jgi:2-phospho-L-lactate guanylyltransferase
MSIWAVIPAKPANEGKSRLAGVLSLEQRIRLNEHLFRRTLAIVCHVFTPGHVMVVSRDSSLLGIAAALGAHAITEHGFELNQALRQAADFPRLTGALLAISADLPRLEHEDVQALLAAPDRVTIAPDRLGQGTNAMLTNPAGCIPFRFGENSFALHCAAATALGVAPQIVNRPGLAFDLDTPEDLRACPGLISG